jgi:hypothetical protein
MQHFEEVHQTRLALRTLAEADQELLFVASVELCVRAREQACGQDPLVAEESLLLAQVPAAYLDATRAVLSDLGRAACAIRTVPAPCVVMDILLGAGEVEEHDVVGILSLALAEGRAAPPAAAACPQPIAELLTRFSSLCRLPCISESALTQGALRWMSGEPLAAICLAAEGCSVGVLCRHLVRIHDFLEEVAQAFECLQVSIMPATCRSAAARICRGLPFLQRGSGRVADSD